MESVLLREDKITIKNMASDILSGKLSDDRIIQALYNTTKLISAHYKNVDNKEKKSHIIIKTGASYRKIFLKDIVYIETSERKLLLHTTYGDYKFYGKMCEIEGSTKNYLVRTHRAYLVNPSYVVSFDSENIILTRGKALMSKAGYQLFSKAIYKE